MFCSKCGTQLPDGANFCHVCGEQLELVPLNTMNSAALGDLNQRMDEEGFSIDQRVMDGSALSKARSVMMPTGDRKNNEALFALYAKLIDPVRALELLEVRIASCVQRIEDARHRKFRGGVAVFFLSLLAVSVLSYWWCFSKSTGADGSFTGDGFPLFVLAYIAKVGTTAGSIALVFLYPLIVGLICATSITIVVSILANLRIKSVINKTSETEGAKVAEYESQRVQIMDSISPYICYVPPDYRTSERLECMVNAFVNCKVENLKEAVLLVDTELYRAQSIDCLRAISDNTGQIMSKLTHMQSTLNSIDQSASFAAANSVVQTIILGSISARV